MEAPFISRLAAEDRCHLNGLAMAKGVPRYVSAVSKSDVADGWRDKRRDGGVVMDLRTNEVVLAGLSMPHSPRLADGVLYLADSGTGRFGRVDLAEGSFEEIAFCPGYIRGMTIHKHFAVVGMSRPRHNKTFSGLALDDELKRREAEPRCGLMVIDLRSGDSVHWLRPRGRGRGTLRRGRAARRGAADGPGPGIGRNPAHRQPGNRFARGCVAIAARGISLISRACLFSLLVCSLASTACRADTLADAIARAVANLPEVGAARANQRAIEENAAQARAAWYPTLDTSLGQGRETSNNPSTRVLGLGSDQTLTRREAELNLSQLIFDGGAASGQVRRFEARALSARDQVAQAAENAGLRAAEAYLEVIRLRALIALAVENEKRHQETLTQVSRLADVGQGRRADAQQAEARLALAQASLTQLRGQLAQAEASFLHLTGQPPGTLAGADSFQQVLPASLPAALAQANAAHPAILAAQKELLAAQADRESQRSSYAAPRLALEVGTSASHDLDGVPGAYTDRFAMLRLRYNLFRGGSDNSRLREAQARVDEALANYGKARNDVERDLRQAWQALAEDRNRLPQLQRYAAASALVVGSYRKQFSIGQRTLLDVLNAENELYSARGGEYSGSYAVTLGELRVLAAMGKLLEALGVNANATPQTRLARKNAETVVAQPQNKAEAADAFSNSARAVADGGNRTEAAREQRGTAVATSLRMSMSLGSAEAGTGQAPR